MYLRDQRYSVDGIININGQGCLHTLGYDRISLKEEVKGRICQGKIDPGE